MSTVTPSNFLAILGKKIYDEGCENGLYPDLIKYNIRECVLGDPCVTDSENSVEYTKIQKWIGQYLGSKNKRNLNGIGGEIHGCKLDEFCNECKKLTHSPYTIRSNVKLEYGSTKFAADIIINDIIIDVKACKSFPTNNNKTGFGDYSTLAAFLQVIIYMYLYNKPITYLVIYAPTCNVMKYIKCSEVIGMDRIFTKFREMCEPQEVSIKKKYTHGRLFQEYITNIEKCKRILSVDRVPYYESLDGLVIGSVYIIEHIPTKLEYPVTIIISNTNINKHVNISIEQVGDKYIVYRPNTKDDIDILTAIRLGIYMYNSEP